MIDSLDVPAQNVEEARRLKDQMGEDFSLDKMVKHLRPLNHSVGN